MSSTGTDVAVTFPYDGLMPFVGKNVTFTLHVNDAVLYTLGFNTSAMTAAAVE